jgi:acetyl esterase
VYLAHEGRQTYAQTIPRGAPCRRKLVKTIPEEVQTVEDRAIPGPASQLPVRIYKPTASGGQHLSALVYFHGGGFVAGGIEWHDDICRTLAAKTPCVVISVDYRCALQ